MRCLTIVFLTAVAVLILAQSSVATGPSHLFVYMEPIAASPDGAVAFKVASSGNASGAHSRLAMHDEYRWLCVTPDGEWREFLHGEVDSEKFEVPEGLGWEEHEQLYVDALKQARHTFQQTVPIESPEPDLAQLLRGCSQETWQPIEPEVASAGLGRATWSPSRFCLDGRCTDQSVPQTTIGGIENSDGRGQVESVFVHGRIALFNNVHGFDPDISTVGADFEITCRAWKECVYDVLVEVSGISIVPASLLSP